MANNNTLSFEVKLDHYIKHQSEAEGFNVDVDVKILGKGSSPLEFDFSCSVNEFIWEDLYCPGKVALYEFLIHDAGIDHDEAQPLLHDMILYAGKCLRSVDDNFKGVFSLMVEVGPKPIELNHAGSEKPEPQESSTAKTKKQRIQDGKPQEKRQPI